MIASRSKHVATNGQSLFFAVLLFFFVSGACGLLYQVVWTRKLVLLIGTTSHAVSAVLSIFFIGLALGSLWGGRAADQTERPLRLYGWFEIAIGLWALLFLLLASGGEGAVVAILRAVGNARWSAVLLRQLLALVLLFVPVFLMGATLPLLARFVNRASVVQGLRIGALYTLNTLGAVVGCFLTGFLLLPTLGYTRATFVGACANGAIGLLALVLSRRTELPAAPARKAPPEDESVPEEGTDVYGLVEGSVARLFRVVPVAEHGDLLVLATDRPDDPAHLEGLAELLGRPVEPVAATSDEIDLMLARHYAPPPPAPPYRSRLDIGLVLTAFLVSGFCGLALEVLWTRLLAIVFLGTTYAYTAMLTTMLCGIALGSAAASAIVDRFRGRMALLGGAFLMTGVGCLLMLGWLAGMPEKVAELQLESGGDWAQVIRGKFFLSFAALIVPTFFLGATFPLVVKIVSSGRDTLGRAVGRLYSVNTVGGVLGAISGTYFLLPLLGTHKGIVVLAMLMAFVGVALLLRCPVAPAYWKVILIALGAAFWAAAWLRAPEDVNASLTAGYVPEDQHVIHYAEGVEGTVVVSEPVDETDGTNRVLWINRVQATTSIEKGVKMNRLQGVLPLLFDRSPRNVLFMCFGSGITAGTLALSDFDRIDAVEISPEVLAAAPLFTRDNLGVLEKPNIAVHVDDGRNYLLTTRQTFDVITFEPMPLALSGVSTFYTREYYELCLSRLAPGGMVSQWVPLHSLNPEVVRSLVHTFIGVFPEYSAWFVNADLFLVGSNTPLQIDYAAADERLSTPKLRAALGAVGLHDTAEVLACFLMDTAGLDAYAGKGTAMTDDRPWAEFAAPKLVYERKVPDALREIASHVAEGLTILDTTHLPQTTVDRLERRHQAHRNDLKGLRHYYAGMAIDESIADDFKASLTIDPDDANARYYLKQITVAQAEAQLRWQEFDKAAALLEDALKYIPGDPDLARLLTQARAATR